MRNRLILRTLTPDRRLFFGLAGIVGAWALVATVAAIQAVALVRLDGRTDVASAVFGRLSIIPLWAIATPFIFRSARRFPVVDRRRVVPGAVAVHIALGSLFLVVANVMIRLPIAFTPTAGGGGVELLVRSTTQGIAEFYPPAMVVYGVIVAIGHVVGRSRAPDEATAPSRVAPPPTVPPMIGVQASESAAPGRVVDMAPQPEGESAPTSAVAAIDGHITVRQWNRVHLVPVEDIDFVEAEDNYVVVHAASRAYKGRDRISDVEQQLDGRRFVRIHRSTIVHVAKIREVQPLTHGDYAVILRDGKVLRVARSRRKALEDALGLAL